MITHFVNGRTFSREKLTEPVVLNFPKAMLGHSVPSDSSKKGLAFKGSIDEFGIFNKSYSEEEIRNIYEIGRPYEIPSRIGSRIPEFLLIFELPTTLGTLNRSNVDL